MQDLRAKKLSRGDAAILLQGCGHLLKAVSEGRKQGEYDEIRTEMVELKQLFEAQQERYSG